jgi:hypothetical protein
MELQECYRLVIKSLRTPLYCMENQIDHYSLLNNCICNLSASEGMRDKAAAFAYFFYKNICEIYRENPYNFRNCEIDFTAFAWALFSHNLIPYTIAGHLPNYLDVLHSFMVCVHIDLVIGKGMLFAGHIEDILYQVYHSTDALIEKKLVCNSMLKWIKILSVTVSIQATMEAIRILHKWKLVFEDYTDLKSHVDELTEGFLGKPG